MKRYLHIFYLFAEFSIQEALAYRFNFINNILSSTIWASFQYVAIFLLTEKTDSVLGWNRGELFLLTAHFNIMIGIFRLFISRNLEELSRIIHFGKLDQYLLKPVDVQFWLTFRHFNVGSATRIPYSILISLLILSFLDINVSLFEYFIFLLLLMVGITILYSIWFMFMTVVIWITNLTNLKTLLDGINGVTKYPREMFDNTSVFLFLLFLPLTLVITVPTEYILNKSTPSEVLLLIFMAVFLLLSSRMFWKFALRYYSSASG